MSDSSPGCIDWSAPSVSVIMAVRGPAPWLNLTLDSLSRQDDVDWELQATLDGPDAKVEDLISGLGPRAHFGVLPAGSGAAACRNQSLTRSRGAIGAVLDSDDLWPPDHLSRHVKAFSNDPQLVLNGTSATPIDEVGNVTGPEIVAPTKALAVQLLVRNVFVHSSVAYSLDAVRSVGMYTEGIAIVEDLDLWLRLALVGNLRNDRAAFIRYRRHESQISRQGIDNAALLQIEQRRRALARKLRVPSVLARMSQSAWSARQLRPTP